MSRFQNVPHIALAVGVAAMLATPFALAAGEGSPLTGGARNPSANETQELGSETEIIANTGTYGTRQSNKSDNGGGAIYGCRSRVGGTERNMEPCIRASNLADGRAFEFETGGPEVGVIRSSNPNAAPFTTNARGVATGLNADQVDGKSAEELLSAALAAVREFMPFAQVASSGELSTARRGIASAKRNETGTYEIVFANDISACALSATITEFEDAGGIGVGVQADKRSVLVRTRAADGAAADRAFHIAATC